MRRPQRHKRAFHLRIYAWYVISVELGEANFELCRSAPRDIPSRSPARCARAPVRHIIATLSNGISPRFWSIKKKKVKRIISEAFFVLQTFLRFLASWYAARAAANIVSR